MLYDLSFVLTQHVIVLVHENKREKLHTWDCSVS